MSFAVLAILGLQQLYSCQADVVAYKYGADFFYQVFSDVPASFGPNLSEHTVGGILINAIPASACDENLKQPPPNNLLGARILLVPAYTSEKNCTFEQKIQMAQLKKYDAVIVYNVGSDELVPMTAKNSTGISIPSVFVSQSSGLMLKNIYTDLNYRVTIMAESTFNVLTYLLIPFYSVVGVCLIVMIIIAVVRYIRNRWRQGRYRLPNSQLSKIPTSKFQNGDRYTTCAVCLEDYVEGEKLRVLPCSHVYHVKCIDPWLTNNKRVCPICKKGVFARKDTNSGHEANDTTPLIRSGNRGMQGGTFEVQNENPLSRAARSISQALDSRRFFTAPNQNIRTERQDRQNLVSSSTSGPVLQSTE